MNRAEFLQLMVNYLTIHGVPINEWGRQMDKQMDVMSLEELKNECKVWKKIHDKTQSYIDNKAHLHDPYEVLMRCLPVLSEGFFHKGEEAMLKEVYDIIHKHYPKIKIIS